MATPESVWAFSSSRKSFRDLSERQSAMGSCTAASGNMALTPRSSSPTDPVGVVAAILEAREREMTPAQVKKARARLTAIAATCRSLSKRRRR
jgi:hypothetical protein